MRNCLVTAGLLILSMGSAGVLLAGDPGLTASSVVRADPSSGRLVRKVIAPRAPKNSAKTFRETARIDRLVEDAARKYGVDPLLIHSVIRAESNYNPFAVSVKGAEGLMQLVPDTAKRFGVNNSFNVEQNIDAGVRYLKFLQDRFDDDELVLAAYNAGEGAVQKYRRIPPYRETQDYVKRVGKNYGELKSKAEETATGEVPRYRPLVAFVDSEGRLHLRTR